MSYVEYFDTPLSMSWRAITPAAAVDKGDSPLAQRLRGMGSSLFWATQLLSVPRREAIYALYAFCREIEDIAGGGASPTVKRALLSNWRSQIASLYAGKPQHCLTRALCDGVGLYGLRSGDFLSIIDGREMDVPSGIKAPTLTELDLYCERVAVAAARLSMQIFGEETSAGERLAAELGRAVQLTLILRDLCKDAERQRLYLPRELLHAHGILTAVPGRILAHPALGSVCRDLASIAESYYMAAAKTIATCPRQSVRPAAVLLAIYRELLHELLARGWKDPGDPVRVSTRRKLLLVFRHGWTGR
jgi:presqualene diphosphate synthase